MKKTIILAGLILLILFSTDLGSFSMGESVQEYLKGKLPAIFNIYLAFLEDLDEQEIEFIDILISIPTQEQRVFAKEVYENGFSIELLERLRDLQKKLEKPYLKVAFPGADNQRITGNPIFVFGCALPAQEVKVTVNGLEADKYDERTGNFLTLVKVPEKVEFPIKITAALGEEGTSLERTVLYEPIWQEMPPEPLAIHTSHVQPRENQILGEGELLRVIVQGSPGCEALFRIGNQGKEIAMEELITLPAPLEGKGIYSGSYLVKNSDILTGKEAAPLPITVLLRRDSREVSRELPGKITFSSEAIPKIVQVSADNTRFNRIRADSFNLSGVTLGGDGWLTQVVGFDLLPETQLKITGKSGEYFRFKLGAEKYLIPQDSVQKTDELEQEIPIPSLSGIILKEIETDSEIRLNFDRPARIPFLITDEPQQLSLVLYGVEQSGDISVEGTAASVKTIECTPRPQSLSVTNADAEPEISLKVELNQQLAGFDYFWDGAELVVRIRKIPAISEINPLQSRIIVLDPGHGGDSTGAIGPGEVHEKNAVLEISRYLQQLLQEKGARIIMTRSQDINVKILERIDRAVAVQADLFVSIHANAHAEGADAVNYHGHMTLYNYSYNQKLAEIMLDNLIERTGLPRTRVWQRADLAVLRRPQVPSVLIETAYLMHPEDNRYLLLPEYQQELALGIRDGIIAYFLNLNLSN